ncbi:MAG TPA: 1,4-alpha-glucan branching enzyme, partial [Pyrinomonadaceae bacterium]|nr:1,4-alpha-glucan branching enzyme [Pyrinomonadaceae bacterium]
GRFDGTALYEHLDPRKGEHPDWGTYIFNYGRNEVRNFLIANALFWLEEFHVDGLRVDAIASMLYLDYSRTDGRWVPNRFGGRENLEAIDFIKELNTVVHELHPGALMIAEESTSWPLVSRGVKEGGLGFDFKWNMGWMHDTLQYFKREPIYRRWHHNNLTFGIVYAWSENFILPFSHDEVVHMKGSMLNKMEGRTVEEKFASLRALYAHMWAHPGKQLLFMGGEIGQWREWNDDQSVDWHLLDDARHAGVSRLVRDLNRVYQDEPALWEGDVEPAGFEWIDANDAEHSVISYLRVAPRSGRRIVSVSNFSHLPVAGYRLALPAAGTYRALLHTDSVDYGGTTENFEGVEAREPGLHLRPYSALIDLPPLTTVWLEVPRERAEEAATAQPPPDEVAKPKTAAKRKAAKTASAPTKKRETKSPAAQGDAAGAAGEGGGEREGEGRPATKAPAAKHGRKSAETSGAPGAGAAKAARKKR